MGGSITSIPQSAAALVDDETLEFSNSKIRLKNSILLENQKQEFAILELQKYASLASQTPYTLLRDIFTDSNGYNNTVASNTAYYHVARMEFARTSGTTNNAHAQSQGSADAGTTNYVGIVVTCNTTSVVYSVTKVASSTATDVRIYDSSNNLIGSATYSGAVAVFATPLTLQSGTKYYIANTKSGTWTHYNGGGVTSTYSMGNFTLRGDVQGTPPLTATESPSTYFIRDIVSIQSFTENSSKTVTVTVPTMPEVVAYELLTIDGLRQTGDSITFALSNGVDTDSGKSPESLYSWTYTTPPTTLIITLANNNASPLPYYPSIKGYVLRLLR